MAFEISRGMFDCIVEIRSEFVICASLIPLICESSQRTGGRQSAPADAMIRQTMSVV